VPRSPRRVADRERHEPAPPRVDASSASSSRWTRTAKEFEQRAAAQREELDRLQLLTVRLTRATSPDWLLVAIHHTEQTDGRIDVVPTGLRFVSAARESTWTVALPVRTDPAQQARDHSEETRFDDPSPLAAATPAGSRPRPHPDAPGGRHPSPRLGAVRSWFGVRARRRGPRRRCRRACRRVRGGCRGPMTRSFRSARLVGPPAASRRG
jgi:hypothetical protein